MIVFVYMLNQPTATGSKVDWKPPHARCEGYWSRLAEEFDLYVEDIADMFNVYDTVLEEHMAELKVLDQDVPAVVAMYNKTSVMCYRKHIRNQRSQKKF